MSEIEWLCKACNTIHPAPDGLNLVCPTCGKGALQPSTLNERRLEAEISQLRAKLKLASKALELYSHCCHGSITCSCAVLARETLSVIGSATKGAA